MIFYVCSLTCFAFGCIVSSTLNITIGGAPGNIIVRYICGIRPLEPGFRKFWVDPQPGYLTYFKVKTPTPHGPIILEMSSPGQYQLSVPPNTEAILAPLLDGKFTLRNG